MRQINDLIQPGAEQILLTGLSLLPRPHRSSFPRPTRSQGITVVDSKESQKSICKKTAALPHKSGKNDYCKTLNHPSCSSAWKYFTGD
jgi:hypothetical protein